MYPELKAAVERCEAAEWGDDEVADAFALFISELEAAREDAAADDGTSKLASIVGILVDDRSLTKEAALAAAIPAAAADASHDGLTTDGAAEAAAPSERAAALLGALGAGRSSFVIYNHDFSASRNTSFKFVG
jgi:hypothetical protein